MIITDIEKLPAAAKLAASRIAARTGETPAQVVRRTAKVFNQRGAVYRVRDILGTMTK